MVHGPALPKEEWSSPKGHQCPLGNTIFPFFYFLPCHVAYRILVPQPGIKPMPPAVEAQYLNHQTTWDIPRNITNPWAAVASEALLPPNPPLVPHCELCHWERPRASHWERPLRASMLAKEATTPREAPQALCAPCPSSGVSHSCHSAPLSGVKPWVQGRLEMPPQQLQVRG